MIIRTLLTAVSLGFGLIATRLASLITRWRLCLHGARVGSNLTARGWLNLHVHSQGQISIGANCRMKSGFVENPVGGNGRLSIWVEKAGKLHLGNNIGISNSTIVCTNSITIDDHVFIGGGCGIYDTDFHSLLPEQRQQRPDKTVKTAPIHIKRSSFIGGHSLILKGVVIGEGAIVGAGSVVTRSIPAGEIWAGNPARFIRSVYQETAAYTTEQPYD